MQTYYDIKAMLKRELDDIVRSGELSAGSLDTIDKILHAIKNDCKIIMYEEYSGDGYSYADADADMTDYSRRGRKRDSMGRYSRRHGYSYRDADMDKVELIKEMMKEATTDDERRALNKILRRLEG